MNRLLQRGAGLEIRNQSKSEFIQVCQSLSEQIRVYQSKSEFLECKREVRF